MYIVLRPSPSTARSVNYVTRVLVFLAVKQLGRADPSGVLREEAADEWVQMR